MNIDSAFFICYGIFSIILGILDKKILLYTSAEYDGLKKIFGKKYKKYINISFGILSIFIGLLLLKKIN